MLIKLKPVTPGSRNKVKILHNFFKNKSFYKLCKIIKLKRGRNNFGKITVRHKSKGYIKKYRIIDFYRYKKDNITAIVEKLEYDPNRNSFIALLLYKDGERKYIISPENLFVGDKIISGDKNIFIKIGNNLPLKNIPLGIKVNNIELNPGHGSKLSRAAGCFAIIISFLKNKVKILLNSGKFKYLNFYCRATIGYISNKNFNLINIGKAGIKINKGIRPTVRGVAMNPVDHPHGGGEGKTSGGRDPVSPWGKLSKGFKKK